MKELFYGDFTPDPRDTALHNRMLKYYRDTPNGMDNKEAMVYWREFRQWCNDRGYTQEEIVKAKRDCHNKELTNEISQG